MKRFGSLFLAAVLGSALTIGVTQWVTDENQSIRIEHVQGIPASQVAFHVNENGEVVPLDFTATAEKVTRAVVHIRSTSEGQTASRERRPDTADPFEFFF